MATQSRFKINGFADTRNSVFANIEDMATASSTWVNFDNSSGKWSVVINGQTPAGFVPKLFDESNILGEIKLVQRDFNSSFTGGKITYPNIDQAGKTDEVSFQLEERYFDTNYYFGDEPDNFLTIDNPFINNVVQAQLILSTEIRQSRLDRVIEFETDYSSIGVRAGEIIEIKNFSLGFGNVLLPNQRGPLFRVVSVEEIDTDEGAIVLAITAIEYDREIYNYAGFTRPEVFRAEPLPPLNSNTGVQSNINSSTGQRLELALQTPEGQGAIGSVGIPRLDLGVNGWSPAQVSSISSPGGSFSTIFGPTPFDLQILQFTFAGPSGVFTYTVDGVTKTVVSGIPLQITYEVELPGGSFQFRESRFMEWSTYTSTAVLSSLPAGSRVRITATTLNTLDLNAADPVVEYVSAGSFDVNANGDAASLVVLGLS